MRTTSLAILSALSVILTSGSAPAQSRLTLNAQEGSTPRAEPARLALATDAGPMLRMPAEHATRRRRNGLPALRRTATTRKDVRISQVPRNTLPSETLRAESSSRTAVPSETSQPAYPRPPLLRRSHTTQGSGRLEPPQPPPELNDDEPLLQPEPRVPTRYSAPPVLIEDGPAPVEGAPSDDAALITHPYQGPGADFFLPPRPCVIHDYWTDYCYGEGGGWLHALGWGCKLFGCRGRCHAGHCGCQSCQGDCGCDRLSPVPVPDVETNDGMDVLLPPGPLPPRNEIPQVRTDDERPPRR